MKRLTVLALLAGAFALPAHAADPLALTVTPLDRFALTEGGEPKAPLSFVGGLILASGDQRFGGLSGIDMIDADNALIISDTGDYVRLRLVHENGRLTGIADAAIESLYPDGNVEKETGDVEDVALDPADKTHGVVVRERQPNAMLTFDLVGGRPENFEPKLVGAPNAILRSNKGLESVAYAPPASPLTGEIVAIAEHPPGGEVDIPGWIAGKGSFTIARSDDYDISSARFLPDGDLLILERRYGPIWGIGMRIRRIPSETIKDGARLDGEVLLEAGMTDQIDNMEGLAVSNDAEGRTILTLVSDDNHNILQRTLILQFALVEE